MTAVDDNVAAVLESYGLTMRATVYGRTGGTGPYNAVVKSDLKCDLGPLNQGLSATQTGPARNEMAARGVIEWERGYTMPISAQIAVDAYGSQRWNVQMTTAWQQFGPGGGLISWRADVVRAI